LAAPYLASSVGLPDQSNRLRPVREPAFATRPSQAFLFVQPALLGEASSMYGGHSICDGLFSNALPDFPTCTKPVAGLPTGVELQSQSARGRQPRHPVWLQAPLRTRVSDTPVRLRCFQTVFPIPDSKEWLLLLSLAYLSSVFRRQSTGSGARHTLSTQCNYAAMGQCSLHRQHLCNQ